jgi:hypothetical protein
MLGYLTDLGSLRRNCRLQKAMELEEMFRDYQQEVKYRRELV